MQSKLAFIPDEVAKLKEVVKDLRAELQTTNTTTAAARNENAVLRTEVEELRAALAEQSGDLNELREEVRARLWHTWLAPDNAEGVRKAQQHIARYIRLVEDTLDRDAIDRWHRRAWLPQLLMSLEKWPTTTTSINSCMMRRADEMDEYLNWDLEHINRDRLKQLDVLWARARALVPERCADPHYLWYGEQRFLHMTI